MRDSSDWKYILSEVRSALQEHNVPATYKELADFVGVNVNSLRREMNSRGINTENLSNPDEWPVNLPSYNPDPVARLLLRHLRKGPASLDELSELLDKSKSSVNAIITNLKENGYTFSIQEETVRAEEHAAPVRAKVLSDQPASKIVFAVASDPHVGSMAAQISAMQAFVDVAYSRHEVEHIIWLGDMSAGQRVYRGQEYEVYAHGADEQLDAIINTIPQKTGLSQYVLGGNHDSSHIKNAGIDIVSLACEARDDFTFLGYDEAKVPLTKDIDILTWHPSGGVPYCLDTMSSILTKRGWVKYDTINMSDEIATLNSDTGQLEYQKPTEIIIQPYKGDMIYFSGKTVDHMVTPNHDVWLRKVDSKNWYKEKAENLLESKEYNFKFYSGASEHENTEFFMPTPYRIKNYDDIVWCVTVPNGIVYVKRNGKPVWTGNSLSYRGQKYAAQITQQELFDVIMGKRKAPKTRFIFWGHLHVADSFPYGPIRVMGPGCFEGKTSYLKQKGLTPIIQGVVIEAHLTNDGLLQRVTSHEYQYVEKENDWKNAWIPKLHKKAAVSRIIPLFNLDGEPES